MQVARAVHVLHSAMYDAWAAYDHRAVGTRLGDLLHCPQAEPSEQTKEAVSFAAYHALIDLFPTRRELFVAVMDRLGYDRTRSAALAHRALSAPSRPTQCSASTTATGPTNSATRAPGPYADWTDYRPVNPPTGSRTPTAGSSCGSAGRNGAALPGPHWGLVAPFSLHAGWEPCPAAGPGAAPVPATCARPSRSCATAPNSPMSTRSSPSTGPTGRTETPPGHWCLLAQWVSARDHHGLDQDVVLFFALGGALHDAAVAAWDAKRAFDSVRPVGAIRWLFAGDRLCAWGIPGQGTTLIKGEDQQPYLPTPPFAEYVSGHSTFSAAAAEVLARYTGSDALGASVTVPAGSSRVEPGTTPATDVTSPGRPSATPLTRPARAATAASTSATATWPAARLAAWSACAPG